MFSDPLSAAATKAGGGKVRDTHRIEQLAAAVQSVLLTRVPNIGRCPTACVVMYHYLGEAVRTRNEGLLTVEGCLANVLTEVIKEHESVSLRFCEYISQNVQPQIKAEARM